MSNPEQPRAKPSAKKTDKNNEIPKRDYRRIPTSWDEASPEDKMMITMKEAGGSWPSIQRAWEHMAGTEIGSSTLSIRYSRIIAHHTHPAEEDTGQLGEEYAEKSFKKLERQRKGHLPPFLHAEAKARENKPVHEAVIGAFLDGVHEAVIEALDETKEGLDEAVNEAQDEASENVDN